MDNSKILTLKEVAEITGISENTLSKKWKQYSSRLLKEFGITKEGRGKKATFYQTIPDDPHKIAYDILREYLINECKFDTRTNFKKLIHYIYLVLINTIDNKFNYKNSAFCSGIKISEKTLISYRNKLTESGFMKPKQISQGAYGYLDSNNMYRRCNADLYESFYNAVINECRELKNNSYKFDMMKSKDYYAAKEFINQNMDIDFIEYKSNVLSNTDYKKYYSLAWYTVLKEWENELGIKSVRFFPKHILMDHIVKDIDLLEIIVNSYNYIIN